MLEVKKGFLICKSSRNRIGIKFAKLSDNAIERGDKIEFDTYYCTYVVKRGTNFVLRNNNSS